MNKYYVLGRVGKEFVYNGWPDEKSARTFYDGENCELIKIWRMNCIDEKRSNCGNAKKLLEYLNKVEEVCEEGIKKVKEGKLSIEELANNLPDKLY